MPVGVLCVIVDMTSAKLTQTLLVKCIHLHIGNI